MIEYLSNWLDLIRRDRSHLLHTLGITLRYYRTWRKSLENGRNSLSDRAPWITFEAGAFLRSVVTSGALVFEYGTGGSTVFYAKRAKRVISVEHDVAWFNRVRDVLTEEGVNNCDCLLIPPDPTTQSHGSPDDPESYWSDSESYSGYSFYRYVSSIDQFPNEFFDFVAIDGRARPSCMDHAWHKVKSGGYLMLDNSERFHYQRAKDLLSNWETYVFYGPGPYNSYFWETTIWRRP